MEIVDTMIRRRINFIYIQETKWVGENTEEPNTLGFKLWYTGKTRFIKGVRIIVDNTWTKVVDVKRVGDRIIALKFIIE